MVYLSTVLASSSESSILAHLTVPLFAEARLIRPPWSPQRGTLKAAQRVFPIAASQVSPYCASKGLLLTGAVFVHTPGPIESTAMYNNGEMVYLRAQQVRCSIHRQLHVARAHRPPPQL